MQRQHARRRRSRRRRSAQGLRHDGSVSDSRDQPQAFLNLLTNTTQPSIVRLNLASTRAQLRHVVRLGALARLPTSTGVQMSRIHDHERLQAFVSRFNLRSHLRSRSLLCPNLVCECTRPVASRRVRFLRLNLYPAPKSSELYDSHAPVSRRTARVSRAFATRISRARIVCPRARFAPSRRASELRHRPRTLRRHASLKRRPEALGSPPRVHAAIRVAHASRTFRVRVRRSPRASKRAAMLARRCKVRHKAI
jgi:hypothetical protein